MAKRTYQLRERAKRQAETRRRIVAAAVALHEEVGPAATTVAEIARRAGVQRLTVYNHFPDDADLLRACTGHWAAEHPPPDLAAWAAVADPRRRLRRALRELYDWYAANERMLAHGRRDAEVLPAMAQVLAESPFEDAAREILLAGRAASPRVGATLALAIDFGTWRRLAGEGLSPAKAATLAAELVEAAAG